MNANQILAALKTENNNTLYFFVKTDIEIYGGITTDTIECFTAQKVKLPEYLKPLIKK